MVSYTAMGSRTWDTAAGAPLPFCHLHRNWRVPPIPVVGRFLAHGATAGYGKGDTLSIIYLQPSAAGMARGSGGKAYVDSLFRFEASADVRDVDHGNRLLQAAGSAVSLGSDYSGAWETEWIFVITVVNAAGRSPAVDPPCPAAALNSSDVECTPPAFRLSRAEGQPHDVPLEGVRVSTFFAMDEFFWAGYDALGTPYLADSPPTICARLGRPDCAFAQFLAVPPVTTDVTLVASGLEPVLGQTEVSLQPGVSLRNRGGTSGSVPRSANLTLGGSLGSTAPPRMLSALASDDDFSSPGYGRGGARPSSSPHHTPQHTPLSYMPPVYTSQHTPPSHAQRTHLSQHTHRADTIRIKFDVAVRVAYRNWDELFGVDPNQLPTVGLGGSRLFVEGLFSFSAKLGEDFTGEHPASQCYCYTTILLYAYTTIMDGLFSFAQPSSERTSRVCVRPAVSGDPTRATLAHATPRPCHPSPMPPLTHTTPRPCHPSPSPSAPSAPPRTPLALPCPGD